jgi:TetR/AcrR family transcriptional repressor of nem operon
MGRTSDAKEKLLAVAFDLIWNHSYGTVSVDDICHQAQVNKGSFYHFFPSKADLAVAAYEEFWQQIRPELDRIFSVQVPPLERVHLWCRMIYQHQQQMAEKCGRVPGCPFCSLGCEISAFEEKIRVKTDQSFERTSRYLETMIGDAVRDGLADVPHPKQMAQNISACVMGFMTQAKIKNDVNVLLEMEPVILQMLGARAVAV